MPGKFQTVDIKKWKGLNEDENPLSLESGELSIAENVWRRGGTIGTRPGTQYEGSGSDWDATVSVAPGVGDPCQGLYDCANNFDATRKLIAIFDGRIYDAHDNVLAVGTETITSGADNFWTFATHAGRVYAAGGDLTTPDTVWYWNLGAGAVTKVVFEETAGGGQIGAKYIVEKWNRLFLNGMVGTALTNNPMLGRYSALNDGTSFPPGNVIGGTSAIGGLSAYGGEFSTGWGTYSDNQGDYLLFLTNRALYSIVQTGDPYTPFEINDRVANGCVSQRVFVDLGVDSQDAIYLSDKGIHSLRQSQAHGSKAHRYLSWKIRNTFKTLNKTRLKYATAAYWKEEGVIIFAVPTGSNSYNDLLLILDIKDATAGVFAEGITAENAVWYIGRLASPTAGEHVIQELIAARDRSTGQPYVYGANRVGDVFRFNITNFSDLGHAYGVHLRTRHDDFGAPGITKITGNTDVWVESTDEYQIAMRYVFDLGRRLSSQRLISLDTSELTLPFQLPAQLGPGTSIQRKVVFGTGHGETIAHDFSHYGGNQPFWLSRVAQEVAGIGSDIGDTDA